MRRKSIANQLSWETFVKVVNCGTPENPNVTTELNRAFRRQKRDEKRRSK